MNDIKARIKSVSSTRQITKAMELVASSKLRRAKEKAESSRPFYELLGSTVNKLKACEEFSSSPFSEERKNAKTLFIVIAGDRGLAGGYNSNIFKLTERLSLGAEALYLPIGKKSFEYLKNRKKELFSEDIRAISEFGVGACLNLGKEISDGFISGKYGKVTLVFTKFVSMMTQLPVYEDLLPLTKEGNEEGLGDVLIEEDVEEMLAKIVPEYIGGVLWSAVSEASASEQGARRSAMNSANKNAEEMIDTLMLKFNRARQAIITQEITEIVSGAEAL